MKPRVWTRNVKLGAILRRANRAKIVQLARRLWRIVELLVLAPRGPEESMMPGSWNAPVTGPTTTTRTPDLRM